MPRFRAGANLVRVDAYVSKDDVALTDLKAEDFALFEDDKPQQIENFQLVQARPPNPQSERRDPDQPAGDEPAGDGCRAGLHAVLRPPVRAAAPARITRASRSSRRSIASSAPTI